MRIGRRLAGRSVSTFALCVAIAVLLGACEVDIETNVTIDPDGSGLVEVGVGLDDAALEGTPDLGDLLATDDLEATGWTVTEPAVEADGKTWVRASKPFGEPAEAAQIFAEVSGDPGPFRDVAVTKSDGFTTTSYAFEGTVDFTAGIEQFSDPELTEALDGEPLGEPVEAIEARFGALIDEMISFRVAVRMPGEVSSNAPTTVANGAVWTPRIVGGEPLTLRATSELTDRTPLIWVGLGALAGVVALLIALVRLALWLRGRSSPDTSA